ncbi:MAG: hypothetical protein ABIL86_10690 [candidate division WOR-3 bacterium]
MRKKIGQVVIFYWLILSCSNIKVEWTRRFEPAGAGSYKLNSLTDSKNIYICGSYQKNNGNEVCLVGVYNSQGNLRWCRLFQDRIYKSSNGRCILLISENTLENKLGIYVLATAVDSENANNLVVLKYDSLGNMQWARGIHKSMVELDGILLATRQNDILAIGWQKSSEDSSTLVISKVLTNGELVWIRKHYLPNCDMASLKFLIAESNELIVGGVLKDKRNFCHMLFDSSGSFLKMTTYESPGLEGALHDIKTDKEGNIYLTGISVNDDTGYDFFILKYDKKNKLLWAKKYDGPAHRNDSPTGLIVDESLSVYVAGSSEDENELNKIVLLKYDKDGNILWTEEYSDNKGESINPFFLCSDIFFYRKKINIERLYITAIAGKEIILITYNIGSRSFGATRFALNSEMNRLINQEGSTVAIETKTNNQKGIVLLKFGEFKVRGISRWD